MARISRDQLLKLQRRYRTDEAIAKLYGISRQAVFKLRKRYGIAPVTGRQAGRDSEIARRYLSGQSTARISRRFRLSTVHIYRILRAQGVDVHRAPAVAQRQPPS
jgi:hypothetical protein